MAAGKEGSPVNALVLGRAGLARQRGRQAELAKVLRGLRVRAVTPDDGRKAGELLEAAGHRVVVVRC
jgi:hypothetical protein